MASNSPEADSKKRRQPINQIKRDKPLTFTTRQYARSRQAPDFNTDSLLDASHIPSPSPTKKNAGQGVGGKPRRALEAPTRRSLAAAYKSTSSTNENRPPSSSSSAGQKRGQQPLKPRPAESTSRGLPRPVTRSENHARVGTPSPTRGRTTNIVSPLSSASSPPRGLAEAYQRIDDEENLAQEESIDNMEVYQYPQPLSERSREADLVRLQRIQDSASPISLKASRRASPRTSIAEPATVEEQPGDDMTIHSDTTSVRSSLDSIRDGSADKGDSQYAKDAQRLHGVLQGQVFRKARVGEKVGLTVENLRRRNESSESVGSPFGGGSVSSRGSDPSLNVPKDWARKARPGRDWLSRINSKSGRYTGDVPQKQHFESLVVAESPMREWEEPIDEWIKAATETPLPSGEDGSSQRVPPSRNATPTNGRKPENAFNKIHDWDITDDEFTGRFLQVSESPPIQIRNAALDRIREREMESLEKRAVTTNRLDELREKTSEESLRRRKPRQASEDLQYRVNGNMNGTPRRRSSVNPLEPVDEAKDQPQISTAVQTDEGDPIPDTPVVVYRSSTQARNKEKNKSGSPRRPSHERRDSHDLLRNLARASSASPSPARDDKSSQTTSKKKERARRTDHTSIDRGTERIDSREAEPEVGEKAEKMPLTSKFAADLQTPVVTGAWVDKDDMQETETPKPSISYVKLKTPMITGAWVDTPLPTGGRGPPMPTPSDLNEAKDLTMNLDEDIRKLASTDLIRKLNPSSPRSKSQTRPPLPNSGPPLPKSALEAIISDAKNSKDSKPSNSSPNSGSEEETLHLGDSTIQSLQEIMENDSISDLLASSPTTPPNEVVDNDINDINDTSAQHDQKIEDDTENPARLTKRPSLRDLKSITYLTHRLNTVLPSLRSTKRSLSSLAHTISSPSQSSPSSNHPQKSLTTNQENEQCNEGGELHDFLFCSRCGSSAQPSLTWEPHPGFAFDLTTVRLPLPRLWTWQRNDWRPRLTWLGVLVLVYWAWYIADNWACETYCHKYYATSYEGYGVDWDAPEPPFVLFKVLWYKKPFSGVLSPFVLFLKLATRFVTSVVGYFVGFIFGDDDGSGLGGSGGINSGGGGGGMAAGWRAKVPVSKDERIPRPAWGPDLSMMDDEYL